MLARRLGLPKDSLRMAPAELMLEVLGVPLGSATPLAAGNPAAAAMVLLLDQCLQLQKLLLVHPLTNTATTLISPADMEAFLRCELRNIARVSEKGRGWPQLHTLRTQLEPECITCRMIGKDILQALCAASFMSTLGFRALIIQMSIWPALDAVTRPCSGAVI